MRQEHDSGSFQLSAGFVDELLTDDRIFGIFGQRLAAVLSKTLIFKPSGPRRKEKKVAQRWGGDVETDAAGMWSECVSIAAQRDMLKWGVMLGIAVGQIVWRRTVKEWRPRLIPWHAQHVRFDWNLRRFLLRTTDGDVTLPHPDEQPRSDGQWVVWCPYGYMGWNNALVRAIADIYIDRQWNRRDWNRHDEVHGQPTIVIKHPPLEDGDDSDRVLTQFDNMGNSTSLALPQGSTKDVQGWDVTLLEATGKGWETFETHKETLDVDLAVLILGQNLTTEVQEGSFAATKEHSKVRDDLVVLDAQLYPVLREQLLTWDALYNHGDADLAPLLTAQVDIPEDEGAEARTLESLGKAVAALWMGDERVDTAAIYDRFGVPMITEGELEAEEDDDPNTPPLPETGDPDNGENEDERTADDAGTAKGNATGQQANSIRRALAAKKPKRTVAGEKRAADYQARLQRSFQKRAAEIMGRHLEVVMTEIRLATSREDLRDRLVRKLRDKLRPDEMGELLRKATVLSHLKGRETAASEV